MRLDGQTLLAIVGMAAATFACRGGGYWLFRRLRPSPALRAVLAYLPGTLLIGYVAPLLAQGGPQQWGGGAVALAVMVATRSTLLAIIGGTAAAWAVWSLT